MDLMRWTQVQLSPGDRLGAYRIDELIASGGMGEVYRAWHPELERHVAIKIIGDRVAENEEAVRRFHREARLASKLDHPHICRVYDYGEQEGRPYLVLELLKGQSVADRYRDRPPPVHDALALGIAIAEGLAHAHDRGLVHRDLKPDNVMLTETGPKILDFGLVKQTDQPLMEDPDSTDTLTLADRPIGTLPYMSPEQLRGEETDSRTDIYSFGALLYRSLSGALPYDARTNAELAAAILHREPVPLRERAPTLPDGLGQIVERCLAKDPDERWQSAAELAGQLKWTMEHGAPARDSRRTTSRWAAAAIGLVAVGAVIGVVLLSDRPATAGLEFSVHLPAGVTPPPNHQNAVISPEGDRLLLAGVDPQGTARFWLRPLSSGRFEPLAGADGGHTPFWSLDGSRFGYFRGEELMIGDIDEGSTQVIASVTLESRGGSWGPDDQILFSPDLDQGIHLVQPGGAVTALTAPDRQRGEIGHIWPQFMPDGTRFVYLVTSPLDSVAGIYLASLDDPLGQRIAHATSSAVTAQGHVLIRRDGGLVALPVERRGGAVPPAAVPVTDTVAVTETLQTMASASEAAITFSRRKDLTQLTWVGADGAPIGTVGGVGTHRNPVVSLGGRVAFEEAGSIHFVDTRSGRQVRVPSLGVQSRNPVWSPDGRFIAFAALDHEGWAIVRWEVNSGSDPVRVHRSATEILLTDWSPDGNRLIYGLRSAQGYDIWSVGVDGAAPGALVDRPEQEVAGRISPTGRYIAYVAGSGSFEVYVEDLQTDLRCQISTAGGFDPDWSDDEDELYFIEPAGGLMVQSLALAVGCPSEAPRLLFPSNTGDPARTRNQYDYDPASGRFLVNRGTYDPDLYTVEVLTGWRNLLGR